MPFSQSNFNTFIISTDMCLYGAWGRFVVLNTIHTREKNTMQNEMEEGEVKRTRQFNFCLELTLLIVILSNIVKNEMPMRTKEKQASLKSANTLSEMIY